MNLSTPDFEPQPEPQERPGRALPFMIGLLLFIVFVILVGGIRESFVAHEDNRSWFGGPGHFAILTEAVRVFEESTGTTLQPSDADIRRTIFLMTVAASGAQDPATSSKVIEEIANAVDDVPSGVPPGLADVWRALQILQRDYPDASFEEVAQAARRSLFLTGDDPALTFLDPTQYEDAQEYFSESSYEGIGARVGEIGEINVITDVFLGSPAEAAGLQALDGIVAVNGMDVMGMPVEDLVEIVKGESGTEVVLEIRRPWDDPSSLLTVSVVRGVVPASLETRILGEDTDQPLIGYIRVERFHRETGDDFTNALGVLLERDIEALILDFRFNPGGSLSGAVRIVSEFVPDGLAMYEMSRDGERLEWDVSGDGQAFEIPLSVLVNSYSASASEVVAGALQDYGRATVYGSRTYGKGSVQAFQELSDGSALYVTVSNWHTPEGRQIQGSGITPDVQVTQTLDDYVENRDATLNAAYWDLIDELTPMSAA